MADKSTIGKRMKEFYEMRTKQLLTRRLPTLIRLDGKAFHTYTKFLDKPFDEGLIEDMKLTTIFLCEQIQGVKCGYTQSDEITLLLTDFDKLETDAWFDYNVQKMVSVAASLATAKFNKLRFDRARKESFATVFTGGKETQEPSLAFFDARVFQIPEKEEVVNCFIWRQRDAEKNSIAMLAQSLFSHEELKKKNGSMMQEMCFQKGHNWNDLHYSKKRGTFIVKCTLVNGINVTVDEESVEGSLWYQPNNQSTLYPDKRGRLLTYTWFEDIYLGPNDTKVGGFEWADSPIETVRTKWEAVETPFFSKDRDSILKLLKYDN